MQKISTSFFVLFATFALGCSEEATADHPTTPDAMEALDVQSPTDTHKVAPPDAQRPSDTRKTDAGSAQSSPDSTIARAPDAGAPDTRPAVISPDTKPAGPQYVNANGWSPDPANQGACCLPCDSVYQGCRDLVQTTPYCTKTVGGTCWSGGKADGVTPLSDSVWPKCLPLKSDGTCGSAGSGR